MPFLFQIQFEKFLETLAINTLEIAADKYRQMREEHTQDWIIDEIQKKALEEGRAVYDLTSLRESLRRDDSIATKGFREWQPPKVWNNLYLVNFKFACESCRVMLLKVISLKVPLI